MRRRDFDGPQRFSIKPGVAVAKAGPFDGMDSTVDDRKFEHATARSRLDVAPSRGIEKPIKRCR